MPSNALRSLLTARIHDRHFGNGIYPATDLLSQKVAKVQKQNMK